MIICGVVASITCYSHYKCGSEEYIDFSNYWNLVVPARDAGQLKYKYLAEFGVLLIVLGLITSLIGKLKK